MAALRKMPAVEVDPAELKRWGEIWLGTEATAKHSKSLKKAKLKKPQNWELISGPHESAPTLEAEGEPEKKAKAANYFDSAQQNKFPYIFDVAFARSLSVMLGNIPVVKPPKKKTHLLVPPQPDCVEVGMTRIVGAIRPQNYDVAYRPDGPRIVFDSKTLNERKSLSKNWQNMVNDLTAEASTVHIRFPMCVVAFIVVVPGPALASPQERDIIRTLERLGSREDELDQHNLAEAVAFVVWDPATGSINQNVPKPGSNLRLETLNLRIGNCSPPPAGRSDCDGVGSR